MQARTLLAALAVVATGLANAQVLVSTDFESNSLGQLAGQSAGGTNVWDPAADTVPVVTNVGPTIGKQAVSTRYAALGAGAAVTHSWVVLGSPGYVIPAGKILRGSVSVYVDGQDLASSVGLNVWANDGANLHGILTLSSGGRAVMRNGTGTPAPTIFTGVTGIVDNAWNRVTIDVKQINATTLESSYFINGVAVPALKHTRTIAAGNLVSDFDLTVYNIDLAGARDVKARYDDYKVEVVPEPATLAVLGLGFAAMARRRRK